ncbi:MAG: oligosaccharide flippase family protein, partial [Thermoanaerobaculia bacterium]
MRHLLLNFSALTVGAVIAQVLTAVALLIAARVLEPARFGAFIGLFGLVTLAATVADFGINAVSVRRMAHHPEDVAAFTTTLSAKVVMAMALGAIWAMLSLLSVVVGISTASDGLVSMLLAVYLVAAVVSTTLAVPL